MSSGSGSSSQHDQKAPPAATNPVNWGFALVAAFALGLALGFFGRPQIIDDVPVQVVVTVLPDNSSGAVVPASSTPAESAANANAPHRAQSMSQASAAAVEPEAPAAGGVPAPGQPTPTIMDFVMSDARHIQGQANAPVTIIEFSDFK